MSLETATSISDLNDSNPSPGDPKSQGDDHLRLIKKILKITFPLFTGPMPIAHDQVASKAYVNQTAFSTSLPGQPGSADPYRLVTRSGMAGWELDSVFADDDRLAEAHAIALSIG